MLLPRTTCYMSSNTCYCRVLPCNSRTACYSPVSYMLLPRSTCYFPVLHVTSPFYMLQSRTTVMLLPLTPNSTQRVCNSHADIRNAPRNHIQSAHWIHWERVVNSLKTFGARCESFETVGLMPQNIRNAVRNHIQGAHWIHWERVVNSLKTFGARCESFETVGLMPQNIRNVLRNHIQCARWIHWERAPNSIIKQFQNIRGAHRMHSGRVAKARGIGSALWKHSGRAANLMKLTALHTDAAAMLRP